MNEELKVGRLYQLREDGLGSRGIYLGPFAPVVKAGIVGLLCYSLLEGGTAEPIIDSLEARTILMSGGFLIGFPYVVSRIASGLSKKFYKK